MGHYVYLFSLIFFLRKGKFLWKNDSKHNSHHLFLSIHNTVNFMFLLLCGSRSVVVIQLLCWFLPESLRLRLFEEKERKSNTIPRKTIPFLFSSCSASLYITMTRYIVSCFLFCSIRLETERTNPTNRLIEYSSIHSIPSAWAWMRR